MVTTDSATEARANQGLAATTRGCRFCGAPLERVVVDLGMSPLCESFLRPDQLDAMEPFYPLRLLVCESCWLVQLAEYVAPEEIFTEYAYFSSFSDSWVAHAGHYARSMIDGLRLDGDSLVVELGSNDGYLLRHFRDAGIPALGVEPAANVAAVARRDGIETLVEFFGAETARALADAGRSADLIVINNVLAQVPGLNDFVDGVRLLLKPDGLVTIEFPHLLRTLEGNQFDQIYHEHFSYFSLGSARRILAAHGLSVVDVEQLETHGGSLRLHVRHTELGITPSATVAAFAEVERRAGLEEAAGYDGFATRVQQTKQEVLAFLIDSRRAGKVVAGYGAPGKATTFLNYCGIRTDLLAYTVDRNPYKHGRFTPGTHIPIFDPARIEETHPDVIWILPWNLRGEIAEQLAGVRDWGGRFLVAIPAVEVF
jgi:SAM-dependent methyltransferase